MGDTRIRWELDQYASPVGYVNKTRMFTISYTTNRGDTAEGTPYILRHRLPLKGIERKFPDVESAKAHAEGYLVRAFKLWGASFED